MKTSSSWACRVALRCAAFSALFLGCPQPVPVVDSGVIDAGCAGALGCECLDGACNAGECVGGTCVDCRRGALACVCRSNNTCNAGLRCSTTSLCEACPAGEQGCACGTGDTCGTGLLCMNGSCVVDTCVAGTAGCPCRTGSACDATLYCDGASLCQTCSNDVPGCPCVNGVCAGAAVCDVGTQVCRAPITCAELISGGGCLPNQACAEGNGADAECVPATCQPEFKWNGSACVACVSPGCATEPSCSDLDGGAGSTCLAQNRTCMNGTCGACLDGFALNGSGTCVPAPPCGSTSCALNEYCDRTSGAPTCTAIPCPAGSAMSNGGICTTCITVPTCTATGFSGRVWPFKTSGDECICETNDNYFIIPGGFFTATRCDADGDGWVREEAGAGMPPAHAANNRCHIQQVDRVRLFDEYGVSVDVLSCNEGLLKASEALPDGGARNGGLPLRPDGGVMALADGGSACTGIVPLRILETARNDLPGSPNSVSYAPVYGSGIDGRLLEAAELNSLTKACVTLNADYNDNKIEDIAEYQGQVAPIEQRPSAPSPDRARLESFSFFLELASASIENGVLNIRERSRCEALFPLHYDADAGTNDQYSLSNDKPYWRTCSRNRDPDYTGNAPTAGFDFAKYGCDTTANTCPLAPPPHPTFIAPVSPATTLFRNHGLCRMGGELPADGVWRGMNHHSQFKCIDVDNALNDPFDRPVSGFGQTNGLLTFNKCAARPCPSPGDLSCSSPLGQGAQTRQPVLDCTAQASATAGNVGFAAVNYRPYRFTNSTSYPGNDYAVFSYQGGCVNEDDAWWDFICAYPEFLLSRARADANFGRYSCYKYASNFVWGGPANSNNRATLRWGGSSNGSALGPRPPPDGGL